MKVITLTPNDKPAELADAPKLKLVPWVAGYLHCNSNVLQVGEPDSQNACPVKCLQCGKTWQRRYFGKA